MVPKRVLTRTLTSRAQPSLTPSATPDAVIDVKLQTLCYATKTPHPISLKTLTEVKFAQEPRDKDDKGDPVVSCPSCRKTITNNVKSYGEPARPACFW